MKVLVLIDAWFPFLGGAQIHTQNLKKILEKNYGVKYFILHSPSSNILIRFLWTFLVIPQAVLLNRKEKFDLIHAHAYWPGIPGKILSLFLRIPIIFTVHGSNLLDLKIKSLKAWLERIILTKIKYDQLITVSTNFIKYKNVNKKIKVIPNGVDLSKFKVKSLKCKITNKNSKIKILYVGRDDPVKGLIYLQKAMVKVKKEFPRVQLRIISGGLRYSQMVKEYKSSHLFVLPSLSEGQPLTLLEAWAARLPVVATAVGDNPRMVKNGQNGYLVKPKDSKALSQTITKVLKRKERNIMGQRGYQLVKRFYTWKKCAWKTFSLYQRVLAAHKQR